MTNSRLQNAISRQRESLAAHYTPALSALAAACAPLWEHPGALDRRLADGLATLPGCRMLYAVSPQGIQVSGNVTPAGVEMARRGQDLSGRPYMGGVVPFRGVVLSEAYVDRGSHRPCLTALHAVTRGDRVLGFLGADFHLRDLPQGGERYPEAPAWQQLRGDPAIRGNLFLQQRAVSGLDRHAEEVMAIVEELFTVRGVFHAKLHYSSSRATVWLTDDPFRYRILALEALLDPDVCLAYPPRPYPAEATVAPERVRPTLERFRALREGDETVYLRSASLNLVNGMVGLTFSCDGSHYMPLAAFLARPLAFWFGEGAT